MKTLLSLSLFLLVIVFAAEGGNMVQFPSGQEKLDGYLAAPEGKGPFPAMIVIHEWWGLNDQIKATADRFAKQGYVALAVDLYRGKATTDPAVARQLTSLPQDRAISDLRAAFAHLSEQSDIRKDRIGSVGYCFGGKYSALLAVNEPKLAACVIYYGSLPTDQESLQKIQAPVIGFFGALDKNITPDSAHNFEQQMKKLGKDVSVTVYPGANHAFANEVGQNYNAEAAKDSWQKMMAFLAQHLQSQK